LGDTVAFIDFVGRLAQVEHDDFEFAAIAGVDGGGGVGESEGVFEGEAAAGADLDFVAGRDFESEAGRDSERNVGQENGVFDTAQIEAGVFERTVGVFGDAGFGRQFFNFDLHCGDSAIIASC